MIRKGGVSRTAALSELYKDQVMYQKAYAVINKMVHPGQFEDLYQDGIIILDANIRAGKFLEESSISTYFIGILKFLCLNEQRKIKNTIPIEESQIVNVRIEMDIESADTKSVLYKAITLLTEKCKKLIALYQLSYSMEEIAAQMSYATSDVAKKEVHLCRKKLKLVIESKYKELMD